MATMGFRRVELFGGAMTADVPDGYGDVSLIRPVPSHQEVYLSATGFTSLIVEITQRVTQPATDQEALLFHFNDVVTSGDTSRVWQTSGVFQLPRFPPQTPTLSLLASTTPPTSTSTPSILSTPSPSTPPSNPPQTSTAMLLTLIRLASQSTDLLLTVNIPLHQPPPPTLHPPDASSPEAPNAHSTNSQQQQQQQQQGVNFAQGRYGALVQEGIEVRDRLLASLVVGDWGLFEV